MTVEEQEMHMQFLLLDLFHIRPWEYNLGNEVYKEDLANMINLKRLQREAEELSAAKERWRAQVQSRIF